MHVCLYFLSTIENTAIYNTTISTIYNSILLTDICHWSFCCDLVVQYNFYSFFLCPSMLNAEKDNCRKSCNYFFFFNYHSSLTQFQMQEFCSISMKPFVTTLFICKHKNRNTQCIPKVADSKR